ncbi:restriction endonuclease subunit S [Cohnella boryungensis]|uniref:Restriction endonuclease subunit S n=1 Tax=Cohnella boryungensis TaxID=768479 RepID=A0ABV8SEW9_9BACL
MSYERRRLGDVALKIGSGATPAGGERVYRRTGVALIRSMNVRDYRFTQEGLVYLDAEQAGKLRKAEALPRDVLLNLTGDSVARCCMLGAEELPARVSQHVAFIRVKPDKADPAYVMYALLHPGTKEELLSLASQGGTRKALTTRMLENVELPLPALPLQRQIANVLSSFDEKIRHIAQMNEKLEQLVRVVYAQWFGSFDYPNAKGKPYRSSGGSMIYSEELEKEIPEGWIAGRLGDIAAVDKGKRPLRQSPVKTEKYRYPLVASGSSRAFVDEALYREPVLVVGRAGTLGVIQRCAEACWPSDNTLVVQSDRYEYAYQLLKDIDYAGLNRGSTQPLIAGSDLKRTPVALPPPDIAEKFERMAGDWLAACERNNKEAAALAAARDALLPKLLSGEIDAGTPGRARVSNLIET